MATTSAYPPGPPRRGTGLAGNARYAYHMLRDSIGFVGRRFERYGDVYYAPSDVGLYVLRHPDHIRQVLATRSRDYEKKHAAFDRLSMVLGSGLLTSDGELWKRHRRMIQPAFHRRRLERYAAVMVDEAARTAARWRPGQVVDVGAEMTELTLRVVCRALFGHDATGDASVVSRAMRTFQESMIGLDLLPAWVPSPGRRRLTRAIADLDRIVYDLVDARSPGAGHDDLLQTLVDAVDDEGDGGRLTRTEVRDELITLFLAGHETTSVALTWTFHLLGRHPSARRALAEELDHVLGRRAPTHDDLDALPWTRQVIEESMRLRPPVHTVVRRARADTEIGPWPVASGSEVAIWIYWTHHDPRWYPQPEAFRPERFAPASRDALPRMAYLPFGGGPRACIGAQFALVEARLILAEIARRFTLEPTDARPVAPRPRITLTPRRPIRMRVRPR